MTCNKYYFKMHKATSKNTSLEPILIKIPMAVAFIFPSRCFRRIDPARDILGNHKEFSFVFLREHVLRNEQNSGALFFHSSPSDSNLKLVRYSLSVFLNTDGFFLEQSPLTSFANLSNTFETTNLQTCAHFITTVAMANYTLRLWPTTHSVCPILFVQFCMDILLLSDYLYDCCLFRCLFS